LTRHYHHPNIVQYIESFPENGTIYSVIDFINGYPLSEKISSLKRVLPVRQVVRLFEKIVTAIEYIHSNGVLHLDLKPANIILTPDENIVIIDFGSAIFSEEDLKPGSYTLEYAPIEQMNQSHVGPETDIFSLGMILYELLTKSRAPCPGERLLSKESKSSDWLEIIPENWRAMISPALRMDWKSRPNDVRQWWDEKPISIIPHAERKNFYCPTCSSSLPSNTSVCPDCSTINKGVSREIIISVNCPNCHRNLAVICGIVNKCKHCLWEFRVSTRGIVESDFSIDVFCPNCSHLNSTSKPGYVRCADCGWRFRVDKLGFLIERKEISSVCPQCAEINLSNNSGEVSCKTCKFIFIIDKNGEVISPHFYRTICPACSSSVRVKQYSSDPLHCPHCNANLFNQQINHKSSFQISTLCPKCFTEMQIKPNKNVICKTCGFAFKGDELGEAINE